MFPTVSFNTSHLTGERMHKGEAVEVLPYRSEDGPLPSGDGTNETVRSGHAGDGCDGRK